jgi:hypothetical protein
MRSTLLMMLRFGLRMRSFARSTRSLGPLHILHLPHVLLFHLRSLLRVVLFHLLLVLIAEVSLLRLFMRAFLLRPQLGMLLVLAVHERSLLLLLPLQLLLVCLILLMLERVLLRLRSRLCFVRLWLHSARGPKRRRHLVIRNAAGVVQLSLRPFVRATRFSCGDDMRICECGRSCCGRNSGFAVICFGTQLRV